MLLGRLENEAAPRGPHAEKGRGEEKVEECLLRLDRGGSVSDATACLIELGEADIPPGLLGRVSQCLMPFLENKDLLVSLKACQILTKIYSRRRTAPKAYYDFFVRNFANGENDQKIDQLLIFLQNLAIVDYTRTRWRRHVFEDDPIKKQITKNTELLSSVLSLCTMKHARYQALVLLWILSFGRSALEELDRYHLFPVLSYVCKDFSKEKDIRVVLAITRNYLSRLKAFQCFHVQKIEDILTLASSRELSDPEAVEDAAYCRERFSLLSRDISSFDAYMGELRSGQLQPLQYHFNNDFWRNNSANISDGRTEILKTLKRYLKSEDAQNVWIAANDLYHLASVCPGAPATLRQLGIQETLFDLLKNPKSEDVRFHAMEALCVCYTQEED